MSVMAADSWGDIIVYNGGRLEPPGATVPLHLQLRGAGAGADVRDAEQGLAPKSDHTSNSPGSPHSKPPI